MHFDRTTEPGNPDLVIDLVFRVMLLRSFFNWVSSLVLLFFSSNYSNRSIHDLRTAFFSRVSAFC
jgi:hypothetical protein